MVEREVVEYYSRSRVLGVYNTICNQLQSALNLFKVFAYDGASWRLNESDEFSNECGIVES
jgi:hypothetical protein